MGLYVETASTDDANPLSGLTNSAIKSAHEGTATQLSKALDLLSAAYLIGNGSNYNEMGYKGPRNGEITTSCNIVTIRLHKSCLCECQSDGVETGNEIEAVITDQGRYSSLNLNLKS
ncbi:hypothetical protein Q3G72_033179 [Acer saccharum]|nr:hypothetical protein Q3G72_033179 [Acer saccharum]